jgi:hypothetical protein
MSVAMLKDNPLALEEYKICKQQIIEDIKWMDQLEIYTVGAVAAVYVFTFTQAKPILVEFLCFIPLFIVLAGALRTAALDRTIGVLNDYIVQILEKNPEIGFTKFYRKNRSFVMKASRYAVWGILIGLTLLFEVLVLRFGAFWARGSS